MSVAAGALFLLVVFLSPARGILSKWTHRLIVSLNITRDHILAYLYRRGEPKKTGYRADEREIKSFLAENSFIKTAIRLLAWQGYLLKTKSGIILSERGRKKAADIMRTHRLWEVFLHKDMNMTDRGSHRTAERFEHVRDDEYLIKNLESETEGAKKDPQGKDIPPRKD
jgi:manganese/zinc/iron transport system permease protein